MNKNKTIFILSLFTALGTTIYWILVFSGIFIINEVVDGYTTWFYSFPLADSWIIFTSAMLAYSIKKEMSKDSFVWGLLTASSMIFLALNGFLFGINTGMLFIMTIDEIIEISIKVYCLSVGGYFIYHFRNELQISNKS